MPTNVNLQKIIINSIPSKEIYDQMKAQGLLEPNQLYLVEEDPSVADMSKSVYDANGVVQNAGGIVEYVAANGGKIDVIKINSTPVPIVDKAVDIDIPTELSELSDDATHRVVTDTEKAAWNAKGTYSKPSGGIPKSDLDSSVQGSLSKADSALQSFTEADPTVPDWAKRPNKPSYTALEVGADPSGTAVAAVLAHDADANAHEAILMNKADLVNGKVPSNQLPPMDFAPAGYGLGTDGAPCSDCNDAVNNGWYRCANAANTPSVLSYGWMIVSSSINGSLILIRQDFYTEHIDPRHYYRYCVNGTWSEWKQCNYAPMTNLLDNPWFTVNQRNANAPDANGYFVDRWIGGAGVTIDQSGSLIFSATSNFILQKLEDKLKAMLVGKRLTASILFSDGTIEAGDQVYTGNDGEQTYFFIGTYFQGVKLPDGDVVFWCVNPTKQVKAVKLELGSASTLANDIAPNYAEERFRCMMSTANSDDTYANKTFPEIDSVTFTDANQCVRNGWYADNTGTATNVPAHWGILFVSNLSYGSALRQDYFVVSSTPANSVNYVRYWHYLGGWSPWEYINPPMETNVVYRTIERRNKLPVYKKQDSNGVQYWSTDQTNWNAESTVKIETGSYVGTGTYKSTYPNSLTFGFAPKFVVLYYRDNSNLLYGFGSTTAPHNYTMFADELSETYTAGRGFSCSGTSTTGMSYGKKSSDGKTYSWYGTANAVSQANNNGIVYHYIAIG